MTQMPLGGDQKNYTIYACVCDMRRAAPWLKRNNIIYDMMFVKEPGFARCIAS